MERTRTALIGLAGAGEDYLTALRGDTGFDLVAVADTNSDLLRRCVEDTSLRAYQDYRSLIVETAHTGLDLLFVALEPFQSIEFVELAASRGIGVFHKAPFARNVEEARRVMALFNANRCVLSVSRTWQYEPAFADLANFPELIGRVYAATAAVRTADRTDGWRGDLARAGGGVMLNGAYEQIDLLTALLGVPQSVQAQCSIEAAPGSVCKYDTEDAATLSMRFKDQRIGSVTAWRGASTPQWNVTLVGRRGTIEMCQDGMTVDLQNRDSSRSRDPGAAEECVSHRTVETGNPIAAAISAGPAARALGNRLLSSTADDHLRTLAVIEAAYLSAKTSAPEAPAQFLE